MLLTAAVEAARVEGVAAERAAERGEAPAGASVEEWVVVRAAGPVVVPVAEREAAAGAALAEGAVAVRAG
ncbi:MAG: hypothetical protein RL653_526 [Pseudomonadota bacterium]|jgi:hypothetical protein